MSAEVAPFAGHPREWDEFVRRQDGWTHFHLHGWKTVIEQVFGHECTYLAVRGDGGALEGVLPLVRVRSVLFGDYLVSLPFVNYGGPLGEPAAVRALTTAAVGMARTASVKLLELRSRTPLQGVDLPVSHRKITVLLDLPSAGAEELWGSFKAKVRSQVRRPQKEGVEVRFGPDQADPFYEVFCRHMRDLGTPVQDRRLFRALARVFPEDVWYGCAYLNGEPIAGGCGFRWAREFEMTWASALREHAPIAPNMLLYWSFMERACQEGLATFNFGRCSPGSGTHRFKRQWGSRDVPLYWYQESRGGQGEAATPAPDQGLFAIATRIWSRLPVPVTRIVGPRIVRYIP